MISLALRNLLARKRRTLLTALAIIVGVAQVTGALILTDSMNRSVDDLFNTGQQNVDVVVTPRGNESASGPGGPTDTPTISQAALSKVKSTDGVRRAVGEVFATTSILKKDGDPISVGPPSFVASMTPPDMTPWTLAGGRWVRNAGETVLEQSAAEKGDYRIGDRVTIVGEQGAEKPKLVGVARFGDEDSSGSTGGAAIAIVTPEEADRIAGRGGRFDDLVVQADPGVTPVELRRTVAAALTGEAVRVRTAEGQAKSQAEQLKEQLAFLQPVLLAFGIIALFVGSFVIVNTFSATLAQRSQELALLRALGATKKQVSRSILIESLLIGVIAGVLGFVGGLLIAPGILGLFKGFGIELPASGTVILPRTVIVALLIGPLVCTLAGLFPVRRAAAVPPVQAMRGDTTREATRRPGPLAFVVAALAGAAVVGSLVTSGTGAAILVGAGALLTLVAVGMLAPLVLSPVVRVVGAPAAATDAVGDLARRNAQRNPRRTATTAGALMVGVALVTFVSVFAAGVSAIASDAFGDRVRADLALSEQGGLGFPPASQDVAAADPGVQRVVGISYGGFDDAKTSDPIVVSGVDEGLQDVYRLQWAQGSDAVLGALGPNDVVADRASDVPVVRDAKIGDRIELERRNGKRFTVTVRGIVDEGNTLLGGGLIGPRALLAGDGGTARVFFSLVKVRDGADIATVQRRVARAMDAKFPTVDVLTRGELEDQIIGQVNQLVNMIYAFLAFALIVSLLGISTTFTLTVQERRRELGMLRAVGATRRQIRRLIRQEAIITGLLGAVLGVAVGLGFGALVARLLADDGFSYVVPVGSIIVVVLLAAAVAALAAALPARRAGKINVVEALAVE